MKPALYVLEGIDGSGKSTAARIIRAKLEKDNIPFVMVDSYPHTEEGKYLRDLWIQKKVPPVSILGIVLYLRAQLIRDVILPALAEGKVVIADRWMPTTRIYQGNGEGISYLLIEEAIDNVLSEFRDHPNYAQLINYSVFFLDLPTNIAYDRVKARGNLDEFEKKPLSYFDRLNKAYQDTSFHTEGDIYCIHAGYSLEGFTKSIHAAMKESQ